MYNEPPSSTEPPSGTIDDTLARTAIENIASATFIFQGNCMRYVNSYALQLTGYSREELLRMPFWATIHKDFQHIVKSRGLARQSGAQPPESYEVKLCRRNGEIRWVHLRVSMISLQGKPAVLGVAEDISERKQMQERLNAISALSERATGAHFFRTLVEAMARTLEVSIVFAAELLPGEPRRIRILAMWNHGQLVEDMTRNICGTPCEQTLAGQAVCLPHGLQDAFPEDCWLQENDAESYFGLPMKDSQGHVIGVMGILHNRPVPAYQPLRDTLGIFADRATVELERLRADRELMASQASLQRIIDHLQETYYQTDRNGIIRIISSSIRELTGHSPDEVIGSAPPSRAMRPGRGTASCTP